MRLVMDIEDRQEALMNSSFLPDGVDIQTIKIIGGKQNPMIELTYRLADGVSLRDRRVMKKEADQ